MTKKVRTKLKTNRGACKRFKVSASGKVRYRKANRNHIKTKQSTKRVRHAKANGVLTPQDGKLVLVMLRT
ncbi:50S ribosomal protein L35 [Candidatus Berkiella cookevillensis]|uniref:Large ribosomal subunit protein bL35 n=1 Tax=Candidatus Berkiella cookevillensis TaxID=437022 RepID=A0A0Q9YNB7_9GAMM|nr:50S ribosomal protein L35 [Candidatus Berkiella cookevillensis]MCS5707974.1 50S ribosomal protein L35 [Candidatus Berkiella cookevillensis]